MSNNNTNIIEQKGLCEKCGKPWGMVDQFPVHITTEGEYDFTGRHTPVTPRNRKLVAGNNILRARKLKEKAEVRDGSNY